MKNVRANPSPDSSQIKALEDIRDQATHIETLLTTPTTPKATIQAAVQAMATAIRGYGTKYNATDIEDALDLPRADLVDIAIIEIKKRL